MWTNFRADMMAVWGFVTRAWVWFIGTFMFRILRFVLVAFLMIKLAGFVFGWWSPAIKDANDRWAENQKKVIANRIDKESKSSEPESGIIAKLVEESAVYDSNNKPIHYKDGEATKLLRINKGSKVMVLDLTKTAANEGSEGMTKVMLRSGQGNFVGGYVVYIPTSVISWGGDKG